MLNQPYLLTSEQIAFYKTNGCIKLKNVLNEAELAYYGTEIKQKVQELNTLHLPMEQRNTYQKAFLQVMNLWLHSEIVKEFVFSKRLAGIAAQLMEVSSVRLYHDQALYKESGGGITPWHADQYYWPMASDKSVTVWVPLQETPVELGSLEFSLGSHHYTFGRKLPISDESEERIQKELLAEGFNLLWGPYELGEVSFHSGWTFHRAGPNVTDRSRDVMTIIYMDGNMKLKAPDNAQQLLDWETWCPGVIVGEIINSHLNPVLFP